MRRCDLEARQLLGRRSFAIVPPPSRAALGARSLAEGHDLDGTMGAATFAMLPRIREAAAVLASYNQRVVHEVHPELSFMELNGGSALASPKYSQVGRDERRRLLAERAQNMVNVLDSPVHGATRVKHYDACACLWTARRIAARGAAQRLPEDPEWDDEGLRMDIWR